MHTFRVGRCFDDMEQPHVGDVIDIDLGFEHDNEGLAVEFNG
jgi:hypothetical protein